MLKPFHHYSTARITRIHFIISFQGLIRQIFQELPPIQIYGAIISVDTTRFLRIVPISKQPVSIICREAILIQ